MCINVYNTIVRDMFTCPLNCSVFSPNNNFAVIQRVIVGVVGGGALYMSPWYNTLPPSSPPLPLSP